LFLFLVLSEPLALPECSVWIGISLIKPNGFLFFSFALLCEELEIYFL